LAFFFPCLGLVPLPEAVLPPPEEDFGAVVPSQPFTILIHLPSWVGMLHLSCFASSIEERSAGARGYVKRNRFELRHYQYLQSLECRDAVALRKLGSPVQLVTPRPGRHSAVG
jgi:hypothetical protein